MLAVHWLNTAAPPAPTSGGGGGGGGSSSGGTGAVASGGESFLLFVTNAGVELYGLGAAHKLKHVKTVPFQLMHHWFLVRSCCVV